MSGDSPTDDGWRPSGRPFGRPVGRKEAPWLGQNERFFAAMGWALSRWNSVEFSLSHFFGALVTDRENVGSYVPYPEAAMTAINSFRSRVEMTDAVASMVLLSTDYKEWTKIRDRCNHLGTLRNRIAHWTLVRTFKGGLELQEPTYLAPKKKKMRKFGEKELVSWGYDFVDLAGDITDMRPKIPGQRRGASY